MSFLGVAAARPLKSPEDDAQKLVENFGKHRWECPAHCECALIQYLATNHGDSWDNVPAFNYIGVSKLSCGACRVWLKAFNKVSRKEFYTRGSHGKWYWPWGMPKAEESLGEVKAGEFWGEVVPRGSLGEIMAGILCRQYNHYLRTQKRYRSDSDSTDVSLSGGEQDTSDTETESIHSELALEEQESNASRALCLASIRAKNKES